MKLEKVKQGLETAIQNKDSEEFGRFFNTARYSGMKKEERQDYHIRFLKAIKSNRKV